MPKTADANSWKVRFGKIAATRGARRASAAAKAGAAVLAVGLFASSPYTNEARAIDTAPNAVNASLVFSPAFIHAGSGAVQTCLRNYSTNDVSVIFVVQRLDQNDTIVHENAATIPANSHVCNQPAATELAGINTDYTSQVIFTGPTQCSQATEYPGKCRVSASWEIFDDGVETGTPPTRLHTEPVLLPGIPGSPRLPNFPQ